MNNTFRFRTIFGDLLCASSGLVHRPLWLIVNFYRLMDPPPLVGLLLGGQPQGECPIRGAIVKTHESFCWTEHRFGGHIQAPPATRSDHERPRATRSDQERPEDFRAWRWGFRPGATRSDQERPEDFLVQTDHLLWFRETNCWIILLKWTHAWSGAVS